MTNGLVLKFHFFKFGVNPIKISRIFTGITIGIAGDFYFRRLTLRCLQHDAKGK